ncbi:MAG: hypothetical protein H6698_00290 [Myxococcales bacterium]|nr:hypothetical protein [Myxococcales bacterium]MCB9521644.1 hypothetical protein [Myxococcales bacterium]MCB9531598.1 hypothetical protein [Myxococcales bacterium]MCB9532750.1 hypothetical protein [Myxococcales bacterium]
MEAYDAQWAPIEVSPDGVAERSFGPLNLQIRWGAGDWTVAVEHEGALDVRSPKPLPSLDVVRFAGSDGAAAVVHIEPRLLDRPVVARPETPIYVLAGETVRLFVSSPLMVALRVGERGASLTEVPTVRLSDTWFGPSTRVGELCYASRTGARLRLADVPRTPIRAVSSVRITNRASTHVRIERVRIPCPELSLYRDESGQLWTEELRLLRTGDGDRAEPVLSNVPEGVGTVTLVSGPRRTSDRGAWLRGLEAVLG